VAGIPPGHLQPTALARHNLLNASYSWLCGMFIGINLAEDNITWLAQISVVAEGVCVSDFTLRLLAVTLNGGM
jgi:hypothetical protein